MTIAMQVEKTQSLGSMWDLNQSERERYEAIAERVGFSGDKSHLFNEMQSFDNLKFLHPDEGKGIECSRVSGELDFSEDEDPEVSLQKDLDAREAAEKLRIKNVQAWINDQSDSVNIRSFNINDIIGSYERDWSGQIVERDYVLHNSNFIDQNGNTVNPKGYVINEATDDIRNKYNYEVVFYKH